MLLYKKKKQNYNNNNINDMCKFLCIYVLTLIQRARSEEGHLWKSRGHLALFGQ